MKRPTASQLRAFNEVASQGSFSRAAAALGVTQPAVTAQIRALEDGFDVRLFERTGAGARLTQIGRRLFHRTSALRDTEREAAEILTAAQALTLGELSIAAGAPGPAMALLARYRALYPGISVQIDFGNWQQVVTAVRSRKADLGLLTGAPGADGFVSQPFLVQRIVALVPEGHGLAGRADVTLAELSREPLLFRTPESLTQRQVNARLAELGLAPEPLMVLAAREAVYEACAQGLGIGFMFDAASTRSDRVRRIPIADLPDSYAEDLFCLESQRKLRTVAAFFHLCGPG